MIYVYERLYLYVLVLRNQGVCVHCAYIYIYIYMYIYIHKFICLCMCKCGRVYVDVYVSVVTYVHMCVNGEIETQGDTTGRQRLLVGMQTTPSANTKVPSRTTQQLLLNIALHHKFQEAERTCRTEEHCIAKLSYSTAQKAMCQPTRF